MDRAQRRGNFTVKLDGLRLRPRGTPNHHRPLSPKARAAERATPEWRWRNGERAAR